MSDQPKSVASGLVTLIVGALIVWGEIGGTIHAFKKHSVGAGIASLPMPPLAWYRGVEFFFHDDGQPTADSTESGQDVQDRSLGNFGSRLLALLEAISLVLVPVVLLRVLLDWISRWHPRWKNTSAFIVAAVSSYAIGFAVDTCVSAATGVVTENVVLPIITWTIIGVFWYLLAAETASSNRAIFIPYLINGGIAMFAGSVKVRYLFVALPLFAIALVIYRRRGTVKSYYEWDDSTGSFRRNG